jgi:hypothetical protein
MHTHEGALWSEIKTKTTAHMANARTALEVQHVVAPQ